MSRRFYGVPAMSIAAVSPIAAAPYSGPPDPVAVQPGSPEAEARAEDRWRCSTCGTPFAKKAMRVLDRGGSYCSPCARKRKRSS